MTRFQDIRTFDHLAEYLQNFTTWEGDEYTYDFSRAVLLFLSVMDNIQKYGIVGELEDIGYYFNDRQRQFIKEIAENANRISDEDVDRR